VPRLLWSHDEDGWVALGFEDVDGRHPYEPWTENDLGVVVSALTRMSADLTPAPIDTGETASDALLGNLNGWQIALARGEDRLDSWIRNNLERLAELEAQAPDAAEGNTLLHFDIRADNVLISDERVYVIDWPWARTGAAWVDWVAFAPSVAMQGGPKPEALLHKFDVGPVAPKAIDAVLCSLAGYFAIQALAPAPPGLPTLRAFQAAQGREAIGWLRERTGWD
jgi:Ser/Thr protein kinase RdoA (MazF antagonist)